MFHRILASLLLALCCLAAQAVTLTPAQVATLKAALLAETDPTLVSYRQAGSTGLIAIWLNSQPTVAYPVWTTGAKVSDLLDSISWAAYTPNDAADGTALYTNRVLVVQTKQMNLQNMLQGRESLNCSKANVRAGLRDAVIQLPTGASGVLQAAGGASGVTTLTACTRLASNGEKYFAVQTATTGTVTAALLVVEGNFTDADVVLALNS